jgi:hypothetical protein
MSLDSAVHPDAKDKLWKRILAYATYLLFWILLSATGLWLIYEVRELFIAIMIQAQFTPWAVRGYDRGLIFVLGLGWFISMIWIEHYLRTGVDKKRLWHNISRVALVQVIVAAFTLAIGAAIPWF